MLNEFIINNNVNIIKAFGIVLIILIILIVILLRKLNSLNRRTQVLERFETVMYLLQKVTTKEEQPEPTTKSDEQKDRIASLNKTTALYKKVHRGQELTEEEQELYEQIVGEN